MEIYLDGQFVPEVEAKVSVFDHGLLYGDGIFEGIRVYGGKVFRLEQHTRRLFDSAKALLLQMPVSPAEIDRIVQETVARNGIQDGYVRLVVTRGKGSLGLSPQSCPKPSIICIAATIQLYPKEVYETGLVIVSCSTRRPSPAALSPQVKSLNYLNNIMAKVEAQRQGADEGLMLNEQGYVAECTGDNIFAIRDGVALTPPIYSGSLDGITRAAAIEVLAEQGVKLVEREMTRHDLYTADEVFVTGTAAEVVPVREIDGREIGDGKPGPVTLRLIEGYRELVHR